MSDLDSTKNLARSVASLGLLMASSRYSLRGMAVLTLNSSADAARWAAAVTLLAGAYYLQYNIWCRCRRRRHGGHPLSDVRSEPQAAYTDVPQNPPTTESEPPGQQMTAAHVYIYVYGWGLLLFASLYCMAGLHESSSCWWALGMLPLCFDELIMRETKRCWVMTIGSLLCCSVVSVWWGASGESAKDENFGLVLLSTVLPVMSPIIFISLRSSVRAVTRDIWRLCELALPFMLLISVCVLTGSYMTEGKRWIDGGGRRSALAHSVNNTPIYRETQSEFYWNGSAGPGWAENSTGRLMPAAGWEYEMAHRFYLFGLLALTPVIAAWCIHIMVWSVVSGYVTEFLVAFLLVLSVKSSVFGEQSGSSIFAIASAGTGFILISLMRKVA
jgi:hypothetical protein